MYAAPIVTIDVVLLTLDDEILKVALHTRNKAPFKNCLALPGGYVHTNEDNGTLTTAMRVLKEKTGLAPRYLEQLGVYSGAERDPRGWSISVCYVALIPIDELRAAGAGVFHFHDVDVVADLPDIAFDHDTMVLDAVTRLRNKARYSTLPCMLLPPEFTLSELHAVYEMLLDEPRNYANFRRKILSLDLVEPTGRHQAGVAHAPAEYYRARGLQLLDKIL